MAKCFFFLLNSMVTPPPPLKKEKNKQPLPIPTPYKKVAKNSPNKISISYAMAKFKNLQIFFSK